MHTFVYIKLNMPRLSSAGSAIEMLSDTEHHIDKLSLVKSILVDYLDGVDAEGIYSYYITTGMANSLKLLH